jgi:hypothetical protein
MLIEPGRLLWMIVESSIFKLAATPRWVTKYQDAIDRENEDKVSRPWYDDPQPRFEAGELEWLKQWANRGKHRKTASLQRAHA